MKIHMYETVSACFIHICTDSKMYKPTCTYCLISVAFSCVADCSYTLYIS